MANTHTSLKFSYESALRFKTDFLYTDQNTMKYLYIGKSQEWNDNDYPIESIDSVDNEKQIWDNIYAAKLITGNDIELGIPYNEWESGKIYTQYDDQIPLDSLISSANGMYVVTDTTNKYNIYKCICNNVSSQSTVKPSKDYSEKRGYELIQQDGYMWKFMYSVYKSNNFIIYDDDGKPEWLPIPISYKPKHYNSDIENIVDGPLCKIKMLDNGEDYREGDVIVTEDNIFTKGTDQLQVRELTNVAVGMFIFDNENFNIIPQDTFIKEIDVTNKYITLSNKTTKDLSSANTLTSETRIIIDGDGNNDYIVKSELDNANNVIRKISVENIGSNYYKADVQIYGTGSGANARVIFSPKYGHGYNPAKELGSKTILISAKMGEIDSTEGNLLSANTQIRQYGILSSPNLYGTENVVEKYNADVFITQTLEFNLTNGLPYIIDEYVYQGNISNPTFSGIVHEQTSNTIKLINIKGKFVIGSSIVGEESNIRRALISVKKYPKFEKYSGDILFNNNVSPIQRQEGQSENLKFILEF